MGRELYMHYAWITPPFLAVQAIHRLLAMESEPFSDTRVSLGF